MEIPRIHQKMAEQEEKLAQAQEANQEGATQLMNTLKRMEIVEVDRDEVIHDTKHIERENMELCRQLAEKRAEAEATEKKRDQDPQPTPFGHK